MDIYIYVHMHIYIHICICTHVYIYLHNSCMRACAKVQQLPCHGSYCELILREHRAGCCFRPPSCPFVEPASLLLARCPTCSLKKSVQIHASSWRGHRCSVATTPPPPSMSPTPLLLLPPLAAPFTVLTSCQTPLL